MQPNLPFWLSFVLTQWAAATPVLLVYGAGIIAALTLARRFPAPAAMVVAGMVVLCMETLIAPAMNIYMVQHRAEWGWSAARFGSAMTAVTVALRLVQAVGIGLLLAAVFRDRPGVASTLPPGSFPTTRVL